MNNINLDMPIKRPIHVGILVSYDYKYLPICLEQIYDCADKITLAIDKNRRTWAGNPFDFDDSFIAGILKRDIAGKISVYEDDFAVTGLGAMECEKRERRMLRDYMESEQQDAWHLQIDTDEYFVDFKSFVEFLHEIDMVYSGNITVYAKWQTLYKLDSDGVFIALDSGTCGYFPVASIGGCRFSPAKNEIAVMADFAVLHQSWGRDAEEIRYKISNWGHNADFDTDAYFEFWKSVNRYNAPYIRDCHPLGRECGWNYLKFEEGGIVDTLHRLKGSDIAVDHQPVSCLIRQSVRRKRLMAIKSSRFVRLIKPFIKHVIGKR